MRKIKTMEITQSGQQTENQMKKNESNIRDLWDYTKNANLYIIGIPEGGEKEKGIENIFKKLCLKLSKAKGNRYKDSGSTEGPKPAELKQITPRHIIIKMEKVKERILKAEREKQNLIIRETP